MSSAASNLAAQEDARMTLAAAAARAERQNQPKGLLYLAGLLMLAALIYVGVNAMSRAGAASALKSAKGQTKLTVEQAGRLKTLRDASAAEGPSLTPGSTQVLSRIEQAGAEVGLKNHVNLPNKRFERAAPGSNASQTKYDYDVKDEDLGKLLAWMEHAVAAVPGLEVYSVSIRPEQHQWAIRVTYARWEKAEGA